MGADPPGLDAEPIARAVVAGEIVEISGGADSGKTATRCLSNCVRAD
jgi:hypothetical protein